MATWRKYFNSANGGLPVNVTGNNTDGYSATHSRYSSWLPEVYAGSPNRLMRYMQYDQMDNDLEINAALDILAEFSTQEDDTTKTPFRFRFTEDPSETEMKILSKTLDQWNNLNDFSRRAFKMVRSTLKYGDQFLIRDPETYKLYWTDPANIEKVIVNESKGKKIETYFVKNLEANFEQLAATSAAALHSRPYGAGGGMLAGGNIGTSAGARNDTSQGASQGMPVDATHVVQLSLTEGMDHNWPFGISILEPVFKVFKQKELLEDSIIIYRVHRAPERRVFFIDVGNMPPHKAQQYLEKVKYEVQQKRVPNKNKDGQNVADAAYNPMSMLEDYFFAQTADGRGSKVDTLPGGTNLGEIDDLKYFNNKLLRGLRVPSSYLPTGPDDGTAQHNDGKVGVAYIQEHQFAKYCQRLQRQIIRNLDREFKMYLNYKGIEIDNSTFSVEFTDPQNFSSYRELDLDTQRAQLFTGLEAVPYLSQQFKLKKYLGLSEEEMRDNEHYWKQENKYNTSGAGTEDVGLRNVGVRPGPSMDLDIDAPIDDIPDPALDAETPDVDVMPPVTPGEL
jgi:hypothetical protein|tara:strand:+ start:455 stop:2140 length:1686 start_codon:yes stop_codon:yes gene_type:complete